MPRNSEKLPDYIKTNMVNGIQVWIRKCPKCDCNIIQKTKYIAAACHKKQRKCRKCSIWSKGLTTETSPALKKLGKKHSKRMKIYRKTNPPWNKGLTKENNDILKRMGENHVGFKHDAPTKLEIGKFAKKCWKENPKFREICLKNLIPADITPENLQKHLDIFAAYRQQKIQEIIVKYGSETNRLKKLDLYYNLVWKYTYRNNLKNLKNYDKWKHGTYELDHKYSIIEGFENEIDPKIIGNIYNIQFITKHKNRVKHRKCSITINKLQELYESKNKI